MAWGGLSRKIQRQLCPRHMGGGDGNLVYSPGPYGRQASVLCLAHRRGFLFASEMKALLRHPAVPPEVDADGVAEPLLTGPGRAPGQGVSRNIRERLPDENASPLFALVRPTDGHASDHRILFTDRPLAADVSGASSVKQHFLAPLCEPSCSSPADFSCSAPSLPL